MFVLFMLLSVSDNEVIDEDDDDDDDDDLKALEKVLIAGKNEK